MPMYEYHCKACNSTFDLLVSFSEANRSQTCPICQSQQTEKKISKVAAIGASSGRKDSTSGSSCGSGGRFR